MIETARVLAGHILAAFSSAMAQAAYLRRHGHLQDIAVARVEECIAAATDDPGARRNRIQPDIHAAVISSN
jgi:hypothetical protein